MIWTIAILVIFCQTLAAIDRTQYIDLNKAKSQSPVLIRCPFILSNQDTIVLIQDEKNGTLIESYRSSGDNFLLDALHIKNNQKFTCKITHSDGQVHTMRYIFTTDPDSIVDISELVYNTTAPLETVKINPDDDQIFLKCGIDSGKVYWFNPDLILTVGVSDIAVNHSGPLDLGLYFCGNQIVNGRLRVNRRFLVVLDGNTVSKDVDPIEATLGSDNRLFPVFTLGQPVYYQPNPVEHKLSSRVHWLTQQADNADDWIVLVDQSRTYYRSQLPVDETHRVYYTRIVDRLTPYHFTPQYIMILFNSEPAQQRDFSVTLDPSDGQLIVTEGLSATVKCSNNYGLPVHWLSGSQAVPSLQLPLGVTSKVADGQTVLHLTDASNKHAGTYYCDAKKASRSIQIQVLPPPKLQSTPNKIIIRPGGKATFLCQLIGGQRGKVLWKRKDFRSFTMDVESMIGGDTSAMLLINNAPLSANGTVYQCSHNVQSTDSILIVRDLCNTGYRSCNNGNCVSSQSFCNGVNDCGDHSDEIFENCAQCEPNQKACVQFDGRQPRQKCIAANWFCDGENDCGNGFDEANCTRIDRKTCLSSHFPCSDGVTEISRVMWCDGDVNCPGGDDEVNCRAPAVIDPSKEVSYVVKAKNSISLVCEVSSVPPPTITWRYNWGRLPPSLNYSIAIESRSNCSITKSILTVHNINDTFAGVYTCEAVSNRRVMAPDYTIFVTAEELCEASSTGGKVGYFNSAAWSQSQCLQCWCSNVTNQCSSAMAMYTSPNPRYMQVSDDVRLTNYKGLKTLETSVSRSLFDRNSNSFRFENLKFGKLISNPDIFLDGGFGLTGSWLNSYGQYLRISMELTGKQEDNIDGPIVVLKTPVISDNLYWCLLDSNSQVIFSTEPQGYTNMVRLLLWEQDSWYHDNECTLRVTSRARFMQSLSQVNRVLIRIKHYSNQIAFSLHNISMDYVMSLNTADKWSNDIRAPFIEQCKCPTGYSGLSCEKCAEGLEKDTSTGKCIRKCPINCLKCSEDGRCQKCEGNRVGVQCLSCKQGFVRGFRRPLIDDCVKCPCNMEMDYGNQECVRDLRGQGQVVCKCNGTEINNPQCDKCLIVPTDESCKNRTLPPPGSQCNQYGTGSLSQQQECNCKEGYSGAKCDQCESGYFSYQGGRCLKCFCGAGSDQCSVSSTAVMRPRHVLDIAQSLLTRRTLEGLSPISQQDGFQLITTREQKRLDIQVSTDLPAISSVVYLSFQLLDKSFDAYTRLYGGKFQTELLHKLRTLDRLMYADVSLFLEIESSKYGRMWSPLQYDPTTLQWSTVLTEYGSPGQQWTLADGRIASRADLLHGLLTARYISLGIVWPSALQSLRINNLLIDLVYDESPANGLVPAPREICSGCVQQKTFCFGCTKPQYQSIIDLVRNQPDIKCGQCLATSSDCEICPMGYYNYNFLNNTRYQSCQIGLEMVSSGRTIFLRKGEDARLSCVVRWQSGGGVALHKWTKSGSSDEQVTTTARYLDESAAESRLDLVLANVNESAEYNCSAANALTSMYQTYRIVILNTTELPRLKVNIGVIITEPEKHIVQFNMTSPIKTPDAVRDYRINFRVIQQQPNSSATLVLSQQMVGTRVIRDSQGNYRVEVSGPSRNKAALKLQVVVTGDRIHQPFYKLIDIDLASNSTSVVDGSKYNIRLDQTHLVLNALEAGRVSVLVDPRINTVTQWTRVSSGGDGQTGGSAGGSLPEGVAVDSSNGNDLVIWSGGSNHQGVYRATVRHHPSGTILGQYFVQVSVRPLNHPHIPTLPSKPNVPYQIYLPTDLHCPQKQWFVVTTGNNNNNTANTTTTNISDRVSVKYGTPADTTTITIDYQVPPRSTVTLECSVERTSHTRGQIDMKYDVKEPIVHIQVQYNQSASILYPSDMSCYDNNTQYKSRTVWIFSDKGNVTQPLLVSQLSTTRTSSKLSWSAIGGFNPRFHEGKYTCSITNSNGATATKSIYLPNVDAVNNTEGTGVNTFIKFVCPQYPLEEESTGDGRLRVIIPQNLPVKVTAEIHGLVNTSVTPMHVTWTRTVKATNQTTVINPVKSGKFHTTILINETSTAGTNVEYRVEVLLNNGTTIRKTLVVEPRADYYRVKLEGLSRDDRTVAVLQGGSHSLQCSLISTAASSTQDVSLSREPKVSWLLIDPYGVQVSPSSLPQVQGNLSVEGTIGQSTLQINLALAALNRYHGRCRVEFRGKIYQSEQFAFDVHQRDIKAAVRILGLMEDKYVSGREGSTVQVTCQAYDRRSGAVLQNAQYSWQLPRSGLAWITAVTRGTNNDTIVFGGLRPTSPSTKAHCSANYFGVILPSESFYFNITKTTDKDSMKPNILVHVIYDPANPPYPIKVIVQDLNPQNDSASVATVEVDNVNFPKYLVRTETSDGIVLEIDYSKDNHTSAPSKYPHAFNPFYHAGQYKFNITNKYGSSSSIIPIPQFNNTNEKYPAKLTLYREDAEQRSAEVTEGVIRVQQGAAIKLVCVYYGHPYPLHIAWDNIPGSKSLANGEVVVTKYYWVSMEIEQMSIDRHSRIYRCQTEYTGQGEKSKQVTIQGYDYGLRIELLNSNGSVIQNNQLSMSQGTDISLLIRIIDLMTGKPPQTTGDKLQMQVSPRDDPNNYTELATSQELANQLQATKVDISSMDPQTGIIRVDIKDLGGSGGSMSTAGTHEPLHLKMRAKFQNNFSQPIEISIQPNKSLYPSVSIEVQYTTNSTYPWKLVCVDNRISIRSKVNFSINPSINQSTIHVNMAHNKAEIIWAIKPSYQSQKFNREVNQISAAAKPFIPYLHQANYKCSAHNKYGTDSTSITLPQFITNITTLTNETDHTSFVRFFSPINTIKEDANNKLSIKIIEGQPWKLVCNYWGKGAPITDVEIIYQSQGRSSAGSTGQAPSTARRLHAEVGTEKFNLSSHAGRYLCRTRTYLTDSSGVIKLRQLTTQVSVEGVTRGYDVVVRPVHNKELVLTLGNNQTLLCAIIDRVTGKELNDLSAVYKWTWLATKQNMTSSRGSEVAYLAENSQHKEVSGSSSLELKGVVRRIEDPITGGQCSVDLGKDVDKKVTYYSEVFTLKINDDEQRKPVVTMKERRNEEDTFPVLLICEDSRRAVTTDTTIVKLGSEKLPTKTQIKTTDYKASVMFPTLSEVNDPLLYAGSYKCRSTNKYGSATAEYKVTYRRPIKKLKAYLRPGEHSQINIRANGQLGDVQVNSKFEMECIYQSDFNPKAQWLYRMPNDTQWTALEPSVGASKSSPLYSYRKKSDTLSVLRDRGWSESGSKVIQLRCEVSDEDNSTALVAKDISINVILVGVAVRVSGLSSGDQKLDALQGHNYTLECQVLDLTTAGDISANFTVQWQLQHPDANFTTGEYLSMDTLTNGGINTNQLNINSIKMPPFSSGEVKGRCLASNATHNFTSSSFVIRVTQDHTRRPVISFRAIYDADRKDYTFPRALNCTLDWTTVDPRVAMPTTQFTIDRSPPMQSNPAVKWQDTSASKALILPAMSSQMDTLNYAGQYTCTASNQYGSDTATISVGYREPLSVMLDSSRHSIYLDPALGIRRAAIRKNRKLELDCTVGGQPMPKVNIYLLTEGYKPDVFIPGAKVELNNQSIFSVDKVNDTYYKIRREYYSGNKPMKFQCDATLNNVTKSSIVQTYEVQDIFKVNLLTDSTQKSRPKAYKGRDFRLGCEMVDYASGNAAPIYRLDWEFTSSGSGEGLAGVGNSVISNLTQLAQTVAYTKEAPSRWFIEMKGVKTIPHGNYIQGRCIAWHNDSYNTFSEPFTISIQDYPEIRSILLTQLDPTRSFNISTPHNYTYNAAKSLAFKCYADFTVPNNKIKIEWFKCSDQCETVSISDTLSFNPVSTIYTDQGLYLCKATIEFDGRTSSSNGSLFISRISAPMFNNKKESRSFRSTSSLSLICKDEIASPRANATWTFEGLDGSQKELPEGTVIDESPVRRHSLSIKKPLDKTKHAGIYKCSLVNQYGENTKAFDVTIDMRKRRKRRYYHHLVAHKL